MKTKLKGFTIGSIVEWGMAYLISSDQHVFYWSIYTLSATIFAPWHLLVFAYQSNCLTVIWSSQQKRIYVFKANFYNYISKE